MQEITESIFYETSYSGVTLGAILLPMGTVMIDAPLRAEDGRAWKAALSHLGGSSNRLLVNLDAHPDRTLGARIMDCTIIAHQKTAQVFRGRPSIFKGQNAESGSEWEAYDEAVGTRWALPDITFTHDLNLHWGPPDVTLEHHPGPTPGAIWAIIPDAKVIFVGDAVLADQPPFLANADLPSWMVALEHLISHYCDYKIVSGRGGLVTCDTVRSQLKHLKYLSVLLDQIAQKDAPLEATESLIPLLLADLNYPENMEEQYYQRLRHGLAQYYAHHYYAHNWTNNE